MRRVMNLLKSFAGKQISNIFILSTGRCGSTTFIHACQHITNYTSAHESRTGFAGQTRLDYPSDHIEADNRLSWFLGRLDQKYGNDAMYVHLLRDRSKVAISYAKRLFPGGIIPAYRYGIYFPEPINTPILSIAEDYVDTVNANIELFLKDKRNKMAFNLENAKKDFREFWHFIGAQGDLEAALVEFDTRYNASEDSVS